MLGIPQRLFLTTALLLAAGALFLAPGPYAANEPYQYIRIGNPKDVSPRAKAGYALMGGGEDLDDAFRWLCDKSPGGDFLVLRAAGGDDYNDYVQKLCHANSVATLIINGAAGARDPRVLDLVRKAEVLFIAGGDQARYVNGWQRTPLQDAINAHIAAGKPIGGTSAGLAVLGEYVYSAQGDAPEDDGLASAPALANPYFHRVTVRHDFLQIPLLHNTLTDSHFAKRDRMGRTLVFLARIVQDGWSPNPREIAIDEKSAVLIEPDGKARVVGSGKGAYFLSVKTPPEICRENTPLTFRDVAVYHGSSGAEFDIPSFAPRDAKSPASSSYSLSVLAGQVQSTQPGNELY